RLVEEVDDRLPAQRRHLLDVALRDLLEGGGGVEDGRDLVRGNPLQPEQMTLREPHGRPPQLSITTSSTPSASTSRTCTCSRREVGRRSPTYCARMGSCPSPRSTATEPS